MRIIRSIAFACYAIALAQPGSGFSTENAEAQKLTLKQALEMALANSPQLKSSEEQLASADSYVSAAVSDFLPTVEAALSAGTFHDQVPSPGEVARPTAARDRNNYEGSVVLRQPIFSGFKNYAALQGRRAERDAKFWQLRLRRAELVDAVVVHYFRLQSLQQQLRAEEEIAVLRERQFSEVKQRFAAGRATELERLQSEYAVAAQKPQLQSLQVDIDGVLLELAQLLGGLPAAKRIVLVDQLEQAAAAIEKQALPSTTQALAIARDSNPSLRQLAAEIDQITHGVGESLAKHLPRLDFELIASTTAGMREDIAAADTTGYGGQLKLSIPLFSGLSSFSERHAAATKKLSLEYDKQQRWNEIVTDLSKQYRQWHLAKTKIAAEKVNIRLTAQTIKAAEASYRNGRVTISDLLDSYAQDLSARRNLAQAYLDQIAAASRIKLLLGVEENFLADRNEVKKHG